MTTLATLPDSHPVYVPGHGETTLGEVRASVRDADVDSRARTTIEWREVVGYPGYRVSRCGRIQSRRRSIERTGLTLAQCDEVRRRYDAGGVTQRELGEEFGVPQWYVGLVVRNTKRRRDTEWRDLKQSRQPNGYVIVGLYAAAAKGPSTCLVHRIVAKAWLEPDPTRRQVNHRNGDKANNDVANLEWATAKENTRHAMAMGLHPAGKGGNSDAP